jgi:hypothetical protein
VHYSPHFTLCTSAHTSPCELQPTLLPVRYCPHFTPCNAAHTSPCALQPTLHPVHYSPHFTLCTIFVAHTTPGPEPHKPSPRNLIDIYWNFILILSSHKITAFPSNFFLSDFPTKSMYVFLFALKRATYPTSLSVSIYSLDIYFLRNTNIDAPQFATVATHLLLHLS